MDWLDVKLEMCRRIRAEPEVIRALALEGKSEKELLDIVRPKRYERQTLDSSLAAVSVFEVPGAAARQNSSALWQYVQVDILVPEQHCTAADSAKRSIIRLFDGESVAGRRMRLLADPGAITAATGFYRTGVRFCFSIYTKN